MIRHEGLHAHRTRALIHRRWRAALLLIGVVLLAPMLGMAQQVAPDPLRDVGIDQRLDAQVPGELFFRDETGREVRLAEYFGQKPIILVFVYYECPMLCTLVLNGLVRALRAMPLTAGRDFTILTVSINPAETPTLAAEKKAAYIEHYGRAEARQGWRFLTGDPPAIHRLAETVGFRYVYDPRTKQYAHAAGIMVLTPSGRVSRYFYGLEYSARDVRLGLVDASEGKIGSPVEKILLLCYRYDPSTGKYSLAILRVIRLAGAGTLLGLGLFLVIMFRRDRRRVN